MSADHSHDPLIIPEIRTTIGTIIAKFEDEKLASKLQEVRENSEVKRKEAELASFIGEVAELMGTTKEILLERYSIDKNIMANAMYDGMNELMKNSQAWDLRSATMNNITVPTTIQIIDGLIDQLRTQVMYQRTGNFLEELIGLLCCAEDEFYEEESDQ